MNTPVLEVGKIHDKRIRDARPNTEYRLQVLLTDELILEEAWGGRGRELR